jgi:NhaP-type Na+/H+ or K+/H+ antiporter
VINEFFQQISIHPQLMIVVPALLILGYALKRTPKIQNWMIIWILMFAGIIASIFQLGLSVNGVANGMIAAGSAITCHQFAKQSVKNNRKNKKN